MPDLSRSFDTYLNVVSHRDGWRCPQASLIGMVVGHPWSSGRRPRWPPAAAVPAKAVDSIEPRSLVADTGIVPAAAE